MATVADMPKAESRATPTVRTCYDLMTVAPACDIMDFTDGKYLDDRNDSASYQAAQSRQAEYLLDQARCGRGMRLLDIGCGYGRILEHAARRGADAIGITISPPQAASCRERGLNVHELNYRDILTNSSPLSPFREGRARFDAIVANGSLEHFVQVEDAAAGRSDGIYQELFAICQKLLNAGGRFVTTAIHFSTPGQFDPVAIARGPKAHRRGSAEFQYAMIFKILGGWYHVQ
jgi:cyclopropane fatty-acyl-phospholipid synthase-like methyltransferase